MGAVVSGPVGVERLEDEEFYATFLSVNQGEILLTGGYHAPNRRVLVFEDEGDPDRSKRLAERIARLLREEDL